MQGAGRIQRRLEQERVKLLYRNLKNAEWNTWLSLIAASALFWQNNPHALIVAWAGFIFVGGFILRWVRNRFRGDLAKLGRVRRAGDMLALAMLLNGIGYGATIWLFWHPADLSYNLLLIAICIIVFMSYTYPLMPLWRAFVLPAAAVSVGLLTRLLAAQEFLYLALALGYFSIAYLFSRGVLNSYRMLTDSLMLRYQLEAANEEVERASNAKNAFFANMSHEIRTPMNGVIGVTQVLADTPLNEEQRKYVSIIENSGRSLLSLIDEILDLTKIESGHLAFSEAPFRIRPWADEIARMFAVLAEQKRLGFDYTFDDAVPPCLVGDQKRLRQVVVNLLGNALKFCEQGGIKFSLRVEELGEQACQLSCVIEDSGKGMPEEKLAKIFDRFERIDESRIGGTGLGLAICKLLVEDMDGEIQVESWQGVGSRFTVTLELPLGECREPEPAHSAPVKVGELAVLVVDDDEINQLVVTNMLKALKHLPTSVRTGKEAIERLQQERFDLVLMDIHMPDMDGVDATRWIRGSDDTLLQGVPVIGMTASIMSEERDAYLDAGMDRVLGKPLRRDELDEAISQVMAAKGGADSA